MQIALIYSREETSCIRQQEGLISVLESAQKYSCHQKIWKTKIRLVNFSLDVKIQSQTEPQISLSSKSEVNVQQESTGKIPFFISSVKTQHTFLVRKSSFDWSKQIISWSTSQRVPKTSVINLRLQYDHLVTSFVDGPRWSPSLHQLKTSYCLKFLVFFFFFF